MIVDPVTLKSKFQKYKVPTSGDWTDLVDSCVNSQENQFTEKASVNTQSVIHIAANNSVTALPITDTFRWLVGMSATSQFYAAVNELLPSVYVTAGEHVVTTDAFLSVSNSTIESSNEPIKIGFVSRTIKTSATVTNITVNTKGITTQVDATVAAAGRYYREERMHVPTSSTAIEFDDVLVSADIFELAFHRLAIAAASAHMYVQLKDSNGYIKVNFCESAMNSARSEYASARGIHIGREGSIPSALGHLFYGDLKGFRVKTSATTSVWHLYVRSICTAQALYNFAFVTCTATVIGFRIVTSSGLFDSGKVKLTSYYYGS